MIEVSADLLARHDRPGPRYTSYPTAIEFSDEFGPEEYAARLEEASSRPGDPLSLYVHLPFCESRCSFCACHVVVARRPEVSQPYIDRVVAESDLMADRLGDRRRVVQYHWGGGTPTHHPPERLRSLHERLLERFELEPGAEVAVEVDPRVTTDAHLETLRDLGFNRISLGVQDLDPTVQRLIGRDQTRAETEHLHAEARRLGYESINFDLVYGLPGQDEETLRSTLDAVIEMRPDRLAVYSFAYVPWMRPHQRRIDEELLPETTEKFSLLATVVTTLTSAGYRQIGMDHFALPDDELVAAADEGTLTRTFMGYTTKRDTETIALGTSGISDIAGAYAQNHRRLASYYESVDEGRLPVERGYPLDADDRVRRHLITELMCNGVVDLADVGERFDIDATEYFSPELEALAAPGGLVDEGMARLDGSTIRATELGRLFVRRIAVVFDVHTARRSSDGPAFSRTV
ncbi:MAG: oxygen-independent coproporphyrinogen III oxidase [Acidimicrobiia bacterium]|nr:oxygen-independent coproporphyrinogen III oxidase [Acidimicrobiia bacterium]